MKKPLIILTGPTAVGKSALSIQLAKAINGEIISADSMQVYRGMDIGTAKITKEEMQGVPHHLIDICEPDETFNVVRFQAEAEKAISQIYNKGKVPIIVGGTGFYIQSVLYHISFSEYNDSIDLRSELEKEALVDDGNVLYEKLQMIDPESARNIHKNNRKRIVRALEYYYQTGQKISEHNAEQQMHDCQYDCVYFVITKNRESLYKSIEQRIDQMLHQGLVKEVEALNARGFDRSLPSMQGLGYKEFLSVFYNELTYDEAVSILKRDTRHYAKRQLTWFRREKNVTWIDKDQFTDDSCVLNDLLRLIKESGIL